jgi:hypothetical protein
MARAPEACGAVRRTYRQDCQAGKGLRNLQYVDRASCRESESKEKKAGQIEYESAHEPFGPCVTKFRHNDMVSGTKTTVLSYAASCQDQAPAYRHVTCLIACLSGCLLPQPYCVGSPSSALEQHPEF